MAIIKNIKNDGASGTIKLHGLISVLTYGDFGGGTATIEASADSNANTLYSEILDANPAGTPGSINSCRFKCRRGRQLLCNGRKQWQWGSLCEHG